MKKTICAFLFLLMFMGLFTGVSYAEEYSSTGWQVVFTSDAKMNSNFELDRYYTDVSGLQPGDTLNMRIQLKNEYGASSDWYMTNKVIESLETSSAASGGGYTYVLTYTHPDGTVDTLYSSERVGGETSMGGRVGLREATANLEDYFYVDSLPMGNAGYVDLKVSLDGETQGNDYQNTAARLQMRFAVEIPRSDPSKPTNVVSTGDTYNRVPLYILMVISGLVLLYFSLDSITDRVYFGGRR